MPRYVKVHFFKNTFTSKFTEFYLKLLKFLLIIVSNNNKHRIIIVLRVISQINA